MSVSQESQTRLWEATQADQDVESAFNAFCHFTNEQRNANANVIRGMHAEIIILAKENDSFRKRLNEADVFNRSYRSSNNSLLQERDTLASQLSTSQKQLSEALCRADEAEHQHSLLKSSFEFEKSQMVELEESVSELSKKLEELEHAAGKTREGKQLAIDCRDLANQRNEELEKELRETREREETVEALNRNLDAQSKRYRADNIKLVQDNGELKHRLEHANELLAARVIELASLNDNLRHPQSDVDDHLTHWLSHSIHLVNDESEADIAYIVAHLGDLTASLHRTKNELIEVKSKARQLVADSKKRRASFSRKEEGLKEEMELQQTKLALLQKSTDDLRKEKSEAAAELCSARKHVRGLEVEAQQMSRHLFAANKYRTDTESADKSAIQRLQARLHDIQVSLADARESEKGAQRRLSHSARATTDLKAEMNIRSEEWDREREKASSESARQVIEIGDLRRRLEASEDQSRSQAEQLSVLEDNLTATREEYQRLSSAAIENKRKAAAAQVDQAKVIADLRSSLSRADATLAKEQTLLEASRKGHAQVADKLAGLQSKLEQIKEVSAKERSELDREHHEATQRLHDQLREVRSTSSTERSKAEAETDRAAKAISTLRDQVQALEEAAVEQKAKAAANSQKAASEVEELHKLLSEKQADLTEEKAKADLDCKNSHQKTQALVNKLKQLERLRAEDEKAAAATSERLDRIEKELSESKQKERESRKEAEEARLKMQEKADEVVKMASLLSLETRKKSDAEQQVKDARKVITKARRLDEKIDRPLSSSSREEAKAFSTFVKTTGSHVSMQIKGAAARNAQSSPFLTPTRQGWNTFRSTPLTGSETGSKHSSRASSASLTGTSASGAPSLYRQDLSSLASRKRTIADEESQGQQVRKRARYED